MNFKQIQLIFILTFIMLDVFLLKVWFDNKEGPARPKTFAIQTELKSKQIHLEKDWLVDTKETKPYISALNSEKIEQYITNLKGVDVFYDELKKRLSVTFQTPIPLELSQGQLSVSDLNIVNEILANKEIVHNGQDYRFLNYYSARKEIVYYQTINDMPIVSDEATVTFVLNGNDIVGYYQTAIEQLSVETTSRPLVSSKDVLTNLYLSSLLAEKITIENMQLVYQKMTTVDHINVYSPVWYIDVKRQDGTIQAIRVDALTNIPLNTTETQH